MRSTTKKDFIFNFGSRGLRSKLTVPVTIPLGQSVQDLAGRLVKAHNLPCYVEPDLYRELSQFVEDELKCLQDENAEEAIDKIRNGDVPMVQLVDNWARAFTEEVKEFARPEAVTNELVFSEVYHALIHSPALETLLNLEHTYALAAGGIIEQRDQDLAHLEQRQSNEMELAVQSLGVSYTDEQVNQLAQRHFENTQLIESKWASELSNLQETQKREYRDWVMRVHEDTQTTAGTPTYVQRVRALSSVVPAGEEDDIIQHHVRMEESFTIHLGAQLKTMHNLRLICVDVLDLCRHKPNRIGGVLVPQPQRLQTAMSLYSNALCGLVLLVDSRLSSYTGIKRVKTAGQNGGQAGGVDTATCWTSVDQFRKLMTYFLDERDKKRAVSLPSSVAQAQALFQLNHWAKGNLDLEIRENAVPLANAYVELMYSILILSQAMLDTTQTRRYLLKQNLDEKCGILLLEDNPTTPEWLGIEDLNRAMKKAEDEICQVDKMTNMKFELQSEQKDHSYKAKEGSGGRTSRLSIGPPTTATSQVFTRRSHSNKPTEFAKVCSLSTDFHFPDLEQQFERIEQDVIKANEWRASQKLGEDGDRISLKSSGSSSSERDRDDRTSRMQPGDFYMTRHSNLSEVHVVFHTVVDDSVRSGDVTSRHSVILGIRNILKACFRYDIFTINIPLLLVHEMSEEMTIPWCLRRAELVFKCVKGFMMELATWGGQQSRTINFLVPKGLSEETFGTISNMLPSIFRMSNPVVVKST